MRVNKNNVHGSTDANMNIFPYGFGAKWLHSNETLYTKDIVVTGVITNAPATGINGAVTIASDLDVRQALHLRGALDNPSGGTIQVNDTVNATNIRASGRIGRFYPISVTVASNTANGYASVVARCDAGDDIVMCEGFQDGSTAKFAGAYQSSTVGGQESCAARSYRAGGVGTSLVGNLQASAYCFDPTSN